MSPSGMSCRVVSFFLSLVLVSIWARPSYGQGSRGPLERVVPALALQADARLLREAFERLHPGLYRYNTTEQLDARWAALLAEFGEDRSVAEAFLAFSRLTSGIRCGHTHPNPFNQSDSVAAAFATRATALPFHFRWIGGRMIVTRSALLPSGKVGSGESLPPGTEILAIDGRPARRILDSLLPFVRADGSNNAKRTALLELQGSQGIETFDLYFGLRFPPTAAAFTLQLRRPGRRAVERLVVQAVTAGARDSALAHAVEPVTRSAVADSVWQFRFLDDTTAYLRMDTWALYNSKWKWQPWLSDRLGLIAARARLFIVDIRRNEGGTEIGRELIARLIDSPLRLPAEQRVVRYRAVPESLRPHLSTWNRTFFDWGEAARPLTNGDFQLQRDTDGTDPDVIMPVRPRIAARVVVLVGPDNSSATFQFASIVQQQRLGVLVGRGTGGNQRGINGGAYFFMKLPNSGLEVDVPLIGYFPEGARPDAGLTPDLLVELSADDIVAGRDAALLRARQPVPAPLVTHTPRAK